jgi:hypothetical protein
LYVPHRRQHPQGQAIVQATRQQLQVLSLILLSTICYFSKKVSVDNDLDVSVDLSEIERDDDDDDDECHHHYGRRRVLLLLPSSSLLMHHHLFLVTEHDDDDDHDHDSSIRPPSSSALTRAAPMDEIDEEEDADAF